MEEKIREMMENAFAKFHTDTKGRTEPATLAELPVLDEMYAKLIPEIIEFVKTSC